MTNAQIVFNLGVSTMAGPIAERRARRPDKEGWKRLISEDRRRAIHEAGHCIAGEALHQFAVELSILSNPERRSTDGRYISGGFCAFGPEQEAETPESNVFVTDGQFIVGVVRLLAPCGPNRRTAIRQTFKQMRHVAEQIIVENWLLILALANELQRRKHMNRAEIKNYAEKVRVYSQGTHAEIG